jgi:polar amino acid transport system substrate-binding protein
MIDIFLSHETWHLILGGLRTTVVIFVFAAIFSVILGAVLSYLKMSHKWPWLFKPLYWFVSTIHDVPSVALMMFFYYAIFAGRLDGILVSIIALGVYTSGALTKIFTVHILQVDRGQVEAGLSLGMSPFQCYRHIVMPQAAKSMLPIFVGELKLLLRTTAYAGYIAQKDLIKAVDAIRELHYDTFLPLIFVSILYLILSWMISAVVNFLYVKLFKYD